MSAPATAELRLGELRGEGEDVVLIVYTSDLDGTTVVEIETAGADVPAIRVYLNDSRIWDHGPTGES